MEQEKKNLLVFGYGLAAILAFIAIRLGSKEGWAPFHFALIAFFVTLALTAALNYKALRPLYGVWMKAAHAIGSTMTFLILFLIFYSVFGIIGIILRVIRKDFLDRGFDPQSRTYWNMRPKLQW